MKKKRNTKSKARRTALLTLLFFLFCSAGTVFSIRKFYDSMNMSLRKMNERPIATIQFKRRTAQRKFEERMVWDRLRQNSPVYNGDTIRTAPDSEATIYFEDGNIVEVGEVTMIQVFLHNGVAEASVQDGEVVVNSTGSENGAVVSFGDSKVQLQAGTSLVGALMDDDGNAQINVLGGQAVFKDADGSLQTLTEGNSLALASDGRELVIPLITVTNPKPNQKVLNFDGGEQNITYIWSTKNLEQDDYLVLEIAQDKNFEKLIHKQELKDINKTSVVLKNGIFHWRIYPAKSGAEYSAVSKLNILDTPRPTLIIPENDTGFSYKVRMPDVRFGWTQNEWVGGFDFELADNPKMENPIVKQRTTTPSSIVSSLEGGTYYWRVTPFYVVNNFGLAEPSEVRRFSIVKKSNLQNVELVLPANGDVVNTTQTDRLDFSWRTNSEPAEYEIIVASDSNFTDSVIHCRQQMNFLSVKPSELAMEEGTWYWYVNQYDIDGVFANKSQIGKFSTSKSQYEQRAIFPPENYSTSDLYAADLRFSWKSNVPGDTVFQIARDTNFNDLVVDETNNYQHHTGTALAGGKYYWRVASKSEPENFATPARTLNITAPLSTPVLVLPADNAPLVAKNNGRSTFAWNKVAGADYYLFNIYSANDLQSAVRSEMVTGNTYSVALDKYASGAYSWSVQACTKETEYNAPRFSGIGRRNFVIQAPKDEVLPPPKRIFVGRARMNYPPNNKIFGVEEIKESREIRFEWAAVPNATNYVFTLRNAQGYILINRNLGKNGFGILDMALLGSGSYTWSVQAVQNDKDGNALARGEIAVSRFVIDLPEDEIIINDTGVLYGM